MSEPVFAVVGHPNKGKSSLVATLARDTSVRISAEPGTTTQARHFPMRVNGRLLYTLVDTPGFQRPRAVLEWLRQREVDAASRPKLVERFVREHSGDQKFRDECELLQPVVEGAGIIFVVDGACPYGPEYEPEMEILRWTGRARMAIINPIGTPQYVEPWRDALTQFFAVIRVLDVVQAPFSQQVELLRAFGQLDESWRQPLSEACDALILDRRIKRSEAAFVIADMIAKMLTLSVVKDIGSDEDTTPHRKPLEESYLGRLRQIERRARSDVEAVYGYDRLDRHETDVELLDHDLLSSETWLAFGLRRADLAAMGAVGGAVVGGMADAALLGSSFLTGTLIGGAVGGALGLFTTDRLVDIKVLHQPLGGRRVRCGPTTSISFPFVVLGRARLHHDLIAGRTHSQRGVLDVPADSGAGETGRRLSDTDTRDLAQLFKAVRRTGLSEEGRATAVETLAARIETLLDDDV